MIRLVPEHPLKVLFGEGVAETQEILELAEDLRKCFKADYEQYYFCQAYRMWQMGWRKVK